MMPTKITVFQIADKIFSFVIENSHIYFVTHNVFSYLQTDKKHPMGVAYIDDHIHAVLAQPILDSDDNVMGT